MKPIEGGSEIFVGVGDYQRTGTDPKERFEVLDRTIRIDSLIPDYRNDTLTRVVMVDSTGRLHWRHISTWPDSVGTGGGGGSNCIWVQNGAGNPITATSFGGLCPTQSRLVGVGIASPTAKLDVYHSTANTGTDNFALQATLLGVGTTNSNHGVSGSVSGSGLNQYGVRGQAQGTTSTSHVYGVAGSAYLPNTSTPGAEAVGVVGVANSGADPTASSVGVMGYAMGVNTSQRWAGYFRGAVGASGSFLSGAPYVMSDAALKTNVQVVSESQSLNLLAQLQPKSYDFVNPNAAFDLPAGTHYGFLAQEVQGVFPDMVRTFTMPAMRDASGVTIEPAQEVMAVNYTEMIPLLVAGMNDLKATVDQQHAQIDLLQAQLAQCCAGGPVDNRSMDGNGVDLGSLDTDLRIVPNPVAANTQLRYTVGTPGRVRLEVTDNSGRVIEVLEEATRSTGSFTYEWNTQQLAAGTYFCTLYMNDEPLVKKAVKLNER